MTAFRETIMTGRTWTIDNAHSSVTFSVRHLMISNVRGEFGMVAGTVTYDPANPRAASVDATVDVATIQTREKDRDEHLRSAEFFDAARFPTMRFVSTGIKTRRGGLEVRGDLTIHGATRPVTWNVDGPSPVSVDASGNERIEASATTKVKRSAFGMTWNKAIEAGGLVVGDEIAVHVDVSLVGNQ
jgi:polyisoprenoid-binding protein YceI